MLDNRITSYNVCYTKLLRSSGTPYTWANLVQVQLKNRITSYNVCYTKLLRVLSRQHDESHVRIRLDRLDLVRVNPVLHAVQSRNRYHGSPFLFARTGRAESAAPRTALKTPRISQDTISLPLQTQHGIKHRVRSLNRFGARLRITSYNVCYTKLLRVRWISRWSARTENRMHRRDADAAQEPIPCRCGQQVVP